MIYLIQIILTAIICFFAVIGLIEIYWEIEYRYVYSKAKRKVITVIPVKENAEKNIEFCIRAAKSIIRNVNGLSDSQIILLDMGVDKNSVGLCKVICKENLGLIYCEKSKLSEYIEKTY